MSSNEAVTVTTLVEVDPARVDAWWRRGPRHRPALRGEGTMRFEPGVGGRFLEVYDDARGVAFEIGKIVVWEPGARLVFEWKPRSFAPGQATEVEVRFPPQGPEGKRTRVTVIHRGWETIPAGHPARHGWEGEAFQQLIGLGWAEPLVSFRLAAARAGKGKAS